MRYFIYISLAEVRRRGSVISVVILDDHRSSPISAEFVVLEMRFVLCRFLFPLFVSLKENRKYIQG
jgi:hypothetical protein